MIKLFSASKFVLSLLLLTAIFFACESNNDDVAQIPLLKEKIGTEVNGKIQLSLDANIKTKWEKLLEKNGHTNVQLQDFALVSEEDNTMLLVSNSKDGSLSLGVEVIKENDTYYLLNNQNIICVGDPGCDAGCKKYKRWINRKRFIWLCPGRCNNGVDCVTSTVIIIGDGLDNN
ncbi:MAG: hypothetical protein AB8G15_16265 [Saprospiraceae bacterium]